MYRKSNCRELKASILNFPPTGAAQSIHIPLFCGFSGLYIISRPRLLSVSIVSQGRLGGSGGVGRVEKAVDYAPVLSPQETNAILLFFIFLSFLFGNRIKLSQSHLNRKMAEWGQQSTGSFFWYVSTFQFPDPLISQNHLSRYQRYTSITSHPSSYGHGAFWSLTY